MTSKLFVTKKFLMPDTIAVIGNCQTESVVECLRALSPRAKIDRFFVNHMGSERSRLDAVASLKKYDLILSHNMTDARFGPFAREALEQQFSNVVFFPQIIFGGFHPDAATLVHEGRVWASPLGSPHSLLLAAAFRLKIPPERAVKLFNAYIFARLGYFAEYDLAKSALLNFASELGYDLSAAIDEWQSTGSFMYIPKHPTLRVLAHISARIAIKAGLPITGSTAGLIDLLGFNVCLPVFPALAKRLGLPGSTTFKLKGKRFSTEVRKWSLEEFARQSYNLYSSYPREIFNSPRFRTVRITVRDEYA
jgi:hypothetical protein